MLFDNEQQVPLECRVGMKKMRQWMEDINLPIKELWFRLDTPGSVMQVNDNTGGPEVRIAFNYFYSHVMVLNQQVYEWRVQLEEDVNDYLNIEGYLVQL